MKLVAYRGVPIRLPADFSKETAGKKGLERSIQNDEKQGPMSKITVSSKAYTVINSVLCIQQSSVSKDYCIHLEWKVR